MFVHEIAEPSVDFRQVLEQDAVAAALAALTQDPADPKLRAAAVAALTSARPESSSDWTEAYASPATASSGRGATKLNGTVAIVGSRGVQIGDTNYQYNRIVHTVSPTIDAAHLLDDTPGLANGLLDVACAPENRRAASALSEVLTVNLTQTLGASSASSTGYGTAFRPPAVGRTLRVTKAAGVTIGDDVERPARGPALRRRRARCARRPGRRPLYHAQHVLEVERHAAFGWLRGVGGRPVVVPISAV